MAGEFLVFQHEPHEAPGMLFQVAEKNGVNLEVMELWKPYKMPELGKHSGLVIMGGPMGVYDGKEVFPSKEDELEYIRSASGRVPMIGFCLGSQLLARAFGAKVYPNIRDGKRIKEVGFYDVDLTDEGKQDPLFRGFDSPIKVLQWHGDAFDLPDGATLLATSPDCTNQAFKYGENIYGTLFHNEMTPDMIRNLAEIDKSWMHDGFEIDEQELIKQAGKYKALMEDQCQRLFANFLSIS